MIPLENALKSEGYRTLNILYPSRKMSLEEISDFVNDKIQEEQARSPFKTIHFVTHSMGGLIARYYIKQENPKNLGKVVMLGTPNKGSEFADFFTETELLAPIFKGIFGPASGQLTTYYEHIDDEITYPLGVIAGDVSINPLAPLILSGAHDGIVAVESTRIEGMSDHITLPASHSFMMFNQEVINQTLHFLQHSTFNRASDF